MRARFPQSIHNFETGTMINMSSCSLDNTGTNAVPLSKLEFKYDLAEKIQLSKENIDRVLLSMSPSREQRGTFSSGS